MHICTDPIRPYRNHGRLGLSKGVKGEAVPGQHTGAIIRSHSCRDHILGIFDSYVGYAKILQVLVVSESSLV